MIIWIFASTARAIRIYKTENIRRTGEEQHGGFLERYKTLRITCCSATTHSTGLDYHNNIHLTTVICTRHTSIEPLKNIKYYILRRYIVKKHILCIVIVLVNVSTYVDKINTCSLSVCKTTTVSRTRKFCWNMLLCQCVCAYVL